MSLRDLSVTPVLERLLLCYRTQIGQVPDPPKSVCLRTGAQVDLLLSTTTDECCTGLAWVRLAGLYPSAAFPEQDTRTWPDGPLAWAAVVELGAARCAPTPPPNQIPSCAQHTNLTEAVLDDAAAMRRALCCFADLDRTRLTLVGQWAPLPTDGGCAGGTQTVTIAVGDCDCTV